MTVADLDAFPDDDGKRYELIEGELFVSCAPGLPHQLVLARLITVFTVYLDQNPIGIAAPGPGAVFSNYDAVVPDMVFARMERLDSIVGNNRFVAAPELVVEIVSPGRENRARDLKAKRRLYGKYGVQEYWIADPENRSVTIFYLSTNTLAQIRIAKDGDEITSPLLPGFTVQVSSIFNLAPWQ